MPLFKWFLLCLLLLNSVNASQQWQIVNQQSTIGFIASYDGIAFNGQFEQFTVELTFDPLDPGNSELNSIINTTSVNTNSRDRDEALADPAWFHFSQFPQATFTSNTFTKIDDSNFQVSGVLTIRDQQREISFPFEWHVQDDAHAKVTAEVILDRRDYAIGNGEWENDETIGFTVAVKISLLLTKM